MRVLKLGDSFTSEETTGDAETVLYLYDMIEDSEGTKWAIALDNSNMPYIVQEGLIDTVKEEYVVQLPKKGRK